MAAGEFLLVVDQAGFLLGGEDGRFEAALEGEFHVKSGIGDVVGVGERG